MWGAQISYQGTSGGPGAVNLATSYGATDTAFDPANATASFSLQNDGDIVTSAGDEGDWVTPAVAGVAAAYECFATLDSGTLTSGTTGSWLALSSTRTWTLQQTVVGTNNAQITIQIREIGTSEILDSTVVTFEAIVEV